MVDQIEPSIYFFHEWLLIWSHLQNSLTKQKFSFHPKTDVEKFSYDNFNNTGTDYHAWNFIVDT